MKKTAIYIHIPFCDHKCIYCDFYSIITHDNMDNYRNALIKEIEFYSQKLSSGREIISIYFGGGTPSLMEPYYIEQIIDEIKKHFTVLPTAEITLETNPGTVDKEKLMGFRKSGINRISVGIQSFNKDELKFLTRIHDAKTALDTVFASHAVGFENISIDLIFNLPGQSRQKWKANLEQAINLPIKHISAYSLILEHGTILNKMVLDGKVRMQNIDHDADLYEFTIEFLSNHNFYQYEVSNFCNNGFECTHNNAYWRYRDYLSFGTSAHSFVNGKRWWNYSSTKFYIDSVNRLGNALIGEELLTKEQMLSEYVMLAFRSKGLDKKEFIRLFGAEWLSTNAQLLDEFKKNNYLYERGQLISLTPSGYALCDEIISRFK